MDELMGKKLINNRGDIGTITEVDRTIYHDNHSKDNPWIKISLDRDPTGYQSHNGCLKTLTLVDWRFLD